MEVGGWKLEIGSWKIEIGVEFKKKEKYRYISETCQIFLLRHKDLLGFPPSPPKRRFRRASQNLTGLKPARS